MYVCLCDFNDVPRTFILALAYCLRITSVSIFHFVDFTSSYGVYLDPSIGERNKSVFFKHSLFYPNEIKLNSIVVRIPINMAHMIETIKYTPSYYACI